jgi:RNA polymerase sigma-70 factor (ECF subfamily)
VAVDTKAESKAEDLSLMRRIAERDPAALRAFYDKHSGLVYTLALRVLNKPDDAEELVGDVFWEVWEKSSRYDQTRSSPLTYLVTLARSRCIDRTRRKGYRQNARMQQVDETSAFSDVTPDEDVSRDEQAGIVRSALAGLDENHRKMLEAAYYDGLTHTEIAERFNKPLGTVKTYIRQGLIRLRNALRTNPQHV